MTEIPDQNDRPESPSKENELRNFLENIYELDQSTPHRDKAEKCYQKLLSRQDEFVGSAIEDEYWNAVSLELFHIGQLEAQNENIEQAKKYFAKSLEAAKKGFSDEWLAYTEGTIHYFDNNQTRLEQTINRANDNKAVLQRFLEGLKKRGEPNYKEDY